MARLRSRGTENLRLSNIIGFWMPNCLTERAKFCDISWHIAKVGKISKLCLYTLKDNLEHYNPPSRTYHCSSIFPSPVRPLDCWTFSWQAIGEFDPALTNHRTVGHSTVYHWTVWHSIMRPLDSWTQHCLTIGQLEKAKADHWTVGHSAHQPLDSWTKEKPTIGLLDTTLSNHWTVGYNTVQLLDS